MFADQEHGSSWCYLEVQKQLIAAEDLFRALLVLASISLVRDAARQPSHFVTMIQDITASKTAQERLRATFSQRAVGIAHFAADGSYLENE